MHTIEILKVGDPLSSMVSLPCDMCGTLIFYLCPRKLGLTSFDFHIINLISFDLISLHFIHFISFHSISSRIVTSSNSSSSSSTSRIQSRVLIVVVVVVVVMAKL